MTRPNKSFVDAAREQTLVLDGAMGTQIQILDPSAEDFGGAEFDGCNELLTVTRPDWIKDIHRRYLEAGADAVETNTFGSNPIVLSEFGIAGRAYELNYEAAKLAREVCDAHAKPAYVVGSVGPGTKLVTLGHVSYDEMLASYRVQMEGLIDGGSDVILIETSQDIQQVKIAVRAAREVMDYKKINLPVMAQVTVELTGTLLVGTDIQAALTVMEAFPIVSVGLNCATGPDEMRPHLQYLAESAPFLLSCLPNAGLPENVKGKTVYPLGPEVFAKKVAELTKTYGINIVGGCCGTTPDHIKALVEALGDRALTKRNPVFEHSAASLYGAVSLNQEPKPLYVGERTNANGSKLFRELLARDDYDGLVQIAKGQLKEGAHILDCCTAYVSRNEVKDMSEFLTRVVTQVNIPIMVDSTETNVIEAALKIIPGKAVVNSINFEDGEEKARKVLALCRTYGASIVALTIDEEGMAKSATRKLEIAERLYRLIKEYGLNDEDIIFDPLTFTLGSGDEEFRKSAVETLNAIKLIKLKMPRVKTILGLSNVSFGLNPYPRRLLNSVMLAHAIDHGLDMAISNAAKILPLFKMDEDERKIFEDLIFDRRKDGYDPLKEILSRYADKAAFNDKDSAIEKASLPLPERLARHIVDGEKIEVIPTLEEALKTHKPLDIINNFLLEGMRVVGEKFGAGEMQLPFVLESAEAMKTAVAFLEPYMDKDAASSKKGKIILATVKGDVHDIGKNLVDIILTNNGFEVVNLGIKQPIEKILERAKEIMPDAIGLSGLLVKSTVIMKSDLEEMQRRQIKTPVILGGAALTRKYVEEDCREVYDGGVYYAQDAFEGLRIVSKLIAGSAVSDERPSVTASDNGSKAGLIAEETHRKPRVLSVQRGSTATSLNEYGQSSWLKRISKVPTPPFWGTRILESSPSDLYSFLDEFALVRSRWQFAKGDLPEEEYVRIIESKARPIINTLKAKVEREKLLRPRAIYGYFSCQSNGNQLLVYASPNSDEVITAFDFPRQKSGRRLCLSDFWLPKESGHRDVIAMQIVTMGHEASDHSAKLYAAHQYSDYFYFHGFSVDMAEAYAEQLHARIRKDLGIHKWDARNMRALFSQGYQGSRYSFGYPACPDLEDNRLLFKCLDPSRINVEITESGQMVPEQSTCAIVAWHPQARYFST